QAKQHGFFGRIWQRIRPASVAQIWILPNSKTAEQVGKRRTDFLLVWAEKGTTPLNEGKVKARWPQCEEVKEIAENMSLVRGVSSSASNGQASSTELKGGVEPSLQVVEQTVAAARQAGDRRREVAALTDLGVVLTGQGNA